MKQLLVLSGKGGTGKTTLTRAIIELCQPPAFADCDVDTPNLHLVLSRKDEAQIDPYYGLDKAFISPELCSQCGLCAEHCRFGAVFVGEQGYQIEELACEGCGVCALVCPRQAITLQPKAAGELRLFKARPVFSTAQLEAGNGNSGLLVSAVKKRLQEAARSVELAVIDGSPGIGCPVIASISGVDLILIVAEPSLSGLSDLERIVATARIFGTKLAVCVNKWDLDEGKTREVKVFCARERIPFVGTIPFDPGVVQATNAGKSILGNTEKAGPAAEKVIQQTMQLLREGHK